MQLSDYDQGWRLGVKHGESSCQPCRFKDPTVGQFAEGYFLGFIYASLSRELTK